MGTDRSVGGVGISWVRLLVVVFLAVSLISGLGWVVVEGAATAADEAVPSAPSAVTAVAGAWEVTVSWSVPVEPGASPIIGYFVTVHRGRITGIPQWYPASTTSTKVLGLKNGLGYQFTVVAFNAAGQSRASAWSNYVTPSTIPAAPTDVTAVAHQNKATVEWTAPADHGMGITRYVVTPYVGGVAQPAKTFRNDFTSQVIYALASIETYTFRVAAVNADGTGPMSAPSASVKPTMFATAPRWVHAVARSGQVELTWIAPARTGNLPLTGYDVTAHAGPFRRVYWFAPWITSASLGGLTNNTGYQFTVVALNADGVSPSSVWSNYVVPSTVPHTPSGVSATGGSGQAIVWWKTPPGTLYPITHYVITPYIGGVAQTPRVIDSTVNAQTITGLVNGTAYQFKVTAVNVIGNSGTSALTNTVVLAADPTTFDDEFNAVAGSSPNAGLAHPVWSLDNCWTSGCGNDSLTQYLASNAYQDGAGDLVLQAGDNPTRGAMCGSKACVYTGAGISMFKSAGGTSWSQEYGTFTARIRLPAGSGLWPSFWLDGSDIGRVGWPACGEIDTLEADGSTTSIVQQHIHYGIGGNEVIGSATQLPAGGSTSGWHTYSVRWTPAGIVWDVDGTPTMVILASSLGTSTYNTFFAHPFSVILDLTVGGDHSSKPNATTLVFPHMLVDYVKAFKT
jgi:beta-glucanase (GH16 family)